MNSFWQSGQGRAKKRESFRRCAAGLVNLGGGSRAGCAGPILLSHSAKEIFSQRRRDRREKNCGLCFVRYPVRRRELCREAIGTLSFLFVLTLRSLRLCERKRLFPQRRKAAKEKSSPAWATRSPAFSRCALQIARYPTGRLIATRSSETTSDADHAGCRDQR